MARAIACENCTCRVEKITLIGLTYSKLKWNNLYEISYVQFAKQKIQT